MEISGPFIELLRDSIPGLQAIYHFGSTVGDQVNPESDIDVAFLSSELMTAPALFELQGRCNQAAGRQIDLVELRRSDPVLRGEVIGNGKLIYENDADVVAEFETASMSMLCAFNEEVREVVSAIVTRGSVYAR